MTLTFPQASRIRVVRVVALATRRGPATEAQALYEDLTPEDRNARPENPRYEGKGRPTGRDRRRMDLSMPDALD